MNWPGLEVALGPGVEFDLVRRFAERWGSQASMLGDDAAVLPLVPGVQLVVSTDTAVEGVHFRREWLTPYEVGWRATSGALSDLAAMAAQPLGVLSALTLPDSWVADAVEIAAGIGDAAAAAGSHIVGGDLSRGGELSLCITVIGSAVRVLSRGGAQRGDSIYVTGRLGAAGASLRAWESGHAPSPHERERFARPRPRISESLWLAARGVHAAIDISDGLVADVWHIAAASAVAVELDLERVPTVPNVTPEQAAASGEEYELVVSTGRELGGEEFRAAFQLELTRIGTVVGEKAGGDVAVLRDGNRVDPPRGYDHFSR